MIFPWRNTISGNAYAIVGWREWVTFPDLGDATIKAKIDTGAKTSALHAWNIKPFIKNDEEWIAFDIHPIQKKNSISMRCEARTAVAKLVKSSNGMVEKRYAIKTTVTVGPYSYPIDLTLTNRDDMGFRLLIGRSALKNRFLVDCTHSFIQSPGKILVNKALNKKGIP